MLSVRAGCEGLRVPSWTESRRCSPGRTWPGSVLLSHTHTLHLTPHTLHLTPPCLLTGYLNTPPIHQGILFIFFLLLGNIWTLLCCWRGQQRGAATAEAAAVWQLRSSCGQTSPRGTGQQTTVFSTCHSHVSSLSSVLLSLVMVWTVSVSLLQYTKYCGWRVGDVMRGGGRWGGEGGKGWDGVGGEEYRGERVWVWGQILRGVGGGQVSD